MAAMLPIFSAIAPLIGSIFSSSSSERQQKSDQKFQAEQAALNRAPPPAAAATTKQAPIPVENAADKKERKATETPIVGDTIAEKQKRAVRAERAAAPTAPTKVTRSGVSIVGGK